LPRGDVIEDAVEQALTALRVSHEVGVDAVPFGGELDDFLVHVAEPDALRGAGADVVAARSGRMPRHLIDMLNQYVQKNLPSTSPGA
jgi:aminoglycoside phosphotransferase